MTAKKKYPYDIKELMAAIINIIRNDETARHYASAVREG